MSWLCNEYHDKLADNSQEFFREGTSNTIQVTVKKLASTQSALDVCSTCCELVTGGYDGHGVEVGQYYQYRRKHPSSWLLPVMCCDFRLSPCLTSRP